MGCLKSLNCPGVNSKYNGVFGFNYLNQTGRFNGQSEHFPLFGCGLAKPEQSKYLRWWVSVSRLSGAMHWVKAKTGVCFKYKAT